MPQTSPIDTALIIGKATDPGRTGKNNEDSYDIFETDWQDDLRLSTMQVAVVADGIGGNNAGEVASRIAVEKIRSVLRSQPTVPIRERLDQAVQLANQEVFNAAQNSASMRGMGSTAVIATIIDDVLQVVHVGDSRAYVVRGNTAFRLTLDHTWAQEAIDHGILTPEAARVHPNRNVIKRYVGVDEAIDVDHKMIDITQAPTDLEGAGRWPMVEQMKLQPGDTVLLCSDGLTDELTDAELQAAVRKYDTQTAADQLVAMANAHGGRDNITVVLIRVPGGAVPVAAPAIVGAGGKSRLPILIAAIVGLLAVAAIAALLLRTGQEPPATPVATSPVVVDTTSTGVPLATEQTAQPTVAVALAETPTEVGPAPTASGLITPTLPGAGTAAPTSTPIPTRTGTPTPPTPTLAPTTRLAPTSATSATAERISPTSSGSVTVGLLSPNNGDAASGNVTFSWAVTAGTLPANQAFEVILWQDGQDPNRVGAGLASPTRGNSATADLAALDADPNFPLEPGTYLWGVRLVQQPSGLAIRLVSESRELRFERPQQPTDTPPTPTEPPP